MMTIHNLGRLLVVLGLLALLGATLRHTQGDRSYSTRNAYDPVFTTVVNRLPEFRPEDGKTTHPRETYVPSNFIGTHLRTSEYLSDPTAYGY